MNRLIFAAEEKDKERAAQHEQRKDRKKKEGVPAPGFCGRGKGFCRF